VLVVFLQRHPGGLPAVLLLLWIKPVGLHEIEAPSSARLVLHDDVEEDPVAIRVQAHRLADLLAEVIEIRAVEVHHVKPGLENPLRPAGVGSVLVDLPPLGMGVGGQVVHAGREINRSVDPGLLGCLVLRPEQVESEVRVDLAHRGRMVAPAMVAFREKGNRIDCRGLQGFLPTLLVEFLPDAGDVRGSVKIKVDLAEAERVWHGSLLGLVSRIKETARGILDADDQR